jgi:hypothetical protein
MSELSFGVSMPTNVGEDMPLMHRRINLRFRSLPVWLAALLLVLPSVSLGTERYDKFMGEYVGEGISVTEPSLRKRDLKVTISPTEDGFQVAWVSVTRRASGKIKRSAYAINFKPSKKEHVYSAAMRTDMFGNQVPLDPMRGDPYVWARIDGDTLFVYQMLINEKGGYEMQVYERTFTSTGLDLKYSRVRDGEVLRTITGKLKRIK